VTDLNDKKQPFLKRALDFIGDRGFYIVLFLCVAVIGVTAWILSSSLNKTGITSKEALSTRVTSAPLPDNSDSKLQDSVTSPLEPFSNSNAPEISANSIIPDMADADASEDRQTVTAANDEAETYMESTDNEQVYEVSAPVATEFMWPVSGKLCNEYSVEALAYDKTMADWRTHSGIDIAAALGAKVVATADGRVESVYKDQMLGTTVVISHGGSLKSVYCNLAAEPTVKAGDVVRMGDVIGSVGETALAEIGDVTHLHFQMTYDGKSINPDNYLPG
jgi:murein DD-endopeptidase MepM/ murein hydrolase activator NlpD